MILAILTCSMSCLASGMQKNILTKDWIVVLAQKDNLPLSGIMNFEKSFRGVTTNSNRNSSNNRSATITDFIN